jgi:4a-hydroxytetrahydrobiopterin dehydratase
MNIPNWQLTKNNHLRKEVKFSNFIQALNYANKVGEIAELQNHHPEITITWGKCIIEIYSHDVNDLTDRDKKFANAVNNILYKP